MATWSLSPQYKKSAVEKMFFYKDGKIITVEQGFRWASFKVESDNRPLTDEELKNEDGYELSFIENDESWEMWEMIDGCWAEIEPGNDKTTTEDVEEFENAWNEDSYDGVESLGWSQDDCEYFYYGPLELTNEDTGEIFKGELDDNISTVDIPLSTDETEDFEKSSEDSDIIDESQKTEWYDISVKPIHKGEYECEFESDTWPFPIERMCEWTGKSWKEGGEKAAGIKRWRGLKSNPNEV